MKIEDELNKRKRQSIKTERIFRILLSIPFEERSIRGISKEAQADYHWTYDNIKKLERLGIIEDNKLVDPKSLFRLWIERPITTLYREYHIQQPHDFIDNIELDYALTTYYAENLIGSYLIPSRMDLYIHERDIDDWHERLIDRGYVGKGNIRILFDDEHVFWDRMLTEPLKTVSLQQLIVDLIREGGVCLEAANIMMERYYGGN